MLNITITLVPSRANQITLFTSAASQHDGTLRLTARLMLILPWPRAREHVNLDLLHHSGIPLPSEWLIWKNTDGFLEGFWLIRAHFGWGWRRARWLISAMWKSAAGGKPEETCAGLFFPESPERVKIMSNLEEKTYFYNLTFTYFFFYLRNKKDHEKFLIAHHL